MHLHKLHIYKFFFIVLLTKQISSVIIVIILVFLKAGVIMDPVTEKNKMKMKTYFWSLLNMSDRYAGEVPLISVICNFLVIFFMQGNVLKFLLNEWKDVNN